MSANKDYLLSYNVHYEIARHLHLERPISKDQMIPTLKAVFIYNLDKERLETELRKFLLTRLLDRYNKKFDFDYEQELSNAIHDYYGANYNHRLNLILSNIKEESNITHTDKCVVTVTPHATWPIQFSNPTRKQVIAPQILSLGTPYVEAYKKKYDKRKLDFLATFGTVELVLDKRHTITVNTA